MAESDQLHLRTLWIELNLIDYRFDFTIAQQIPNHLNVEIGYSDTRSQSFGNELLHVGPYLVHGLLWLRKIACRPMDVVKVDVINLQLLQLALQCSLHIIILRMSNFCSDMKLFSFLACLKASL
jgi:hypothetical protein